MTSQQQHSKEIFYAHKLRKRLESTRILITTQKKTYVELNCNDKEALLTLLATVHTLATGLRRLKI